MPSIPELQAAAESLRATWLPRIAGVANLDAWTEARNALFARKSGLVPGLMATLPEYLPEERRQAGAMVNALKEELEQVLAGRHDALSAVPSSELSLDLTMPGRATWRGARHPVTIVLDEIAQIFQELGFTIALGPEAESDWYNFGALNFPADHPAMDLHDTLYLEQGALL